MYIRRLACSSSSSGIQGRSILAASFESRTYVAASFESRTYVAASFESCTSVATHLQCKTTGGKVKVTYQYTNQQNKVLAMDYLYDMIPVQLFT